MNPVDKLLYLQKRAFESSPWHSLKAALANIGETEFLWIPPKHQGFPWMNGSIRDIVYHVSGDKLVQVSAALGGGEITWENVGLGKADIGSMMSQLTSSHSVVVNALKMQSENTLSEKVTSWGGKKLSAEELFLMLIEHDLYHAGQIRYIRNLVGADS